MRAFVNRSHTDVNDNRDQSRRASFYARPRHCTLTGRATRPAMASLEISRARTARSHRRSRMPRRILFFVLLAALVARPAVPTPAESHPALGGRGHEPVM